MTSPAPIFSVLRYLMAELGIKSAEWNQLSDKDKADLRQYAQDEAVVLGLTK